MDQDPKRPFDCDSNLAEVEVVRVLLERNIASRNWRGHCIIFAKGIIYDGKGLLIGTRKCTAIVPSIELTACNCMPPSHQVTSTLGKLTSNVRCRPGEVVPSKSGVG